MFGAIGSAIYMARAATLPQPVVAASGQCINAGIPVRLANCDQSPSQQWQHSRDQPFENAGQCLDIDRTAGRYVRMGDCDGSKYQRWHLNDTGALVNLGNAECLQPVPGNPNGALEIAACSGGATQQWKVIE